MKLICWIVGHRTRWTRNKEAGTLLLIPCCERCKKSIANSRSGHLDPFYI